MAGAGTEGGAGGYVDTSEALRSALVLNPHMRLLMCYGWYDLACPFGAAHYTLNHMDLNAQTTARISWRYYTAGHMMYIERASREKLASDVAEFIGKG